MQIRSISRPLVDLIAKDKLPATVTLLRPPTFDQLRSHLRAHKNHYHILHFDGHGSYGSMAAEANPHALTLQGPQGQLIFEDVNGKPDPQRASVLSELLREFHVPVVVLNACQSAMVDDAADDAFASVAAGLQKSGVRSVVAMAYSLYVSGAQQFLPAFYQRLFETGSAGMPPELVGSRPSLIRIGFVPAASFRWKTVSNSRWSALGRLIWRRLTKVGTGLGLRWVLAGKSDRLEVPRIAKIGG